MNDVQSNEVLNGLHRIQFTNDENKLFAYHLLETDRGFILFDTGMDDTPESRIKPYLSELGYDLGDVSMAIMTHADADHIGGNASLREANPDVLLMAHRQDVPMVERRDRIMDDRYNQFARYGVEYPEEIKQALNGMMRTDETVDVHLDGGEVLAWKNGRFQIFHAPGHSPGSIVAFDPEQDVMIGGDAVYPEGTITLSGEVIQPPPYENLSDYRSTRSLIKELNPDLLLMSHFPPFEGNEVDTFLERSQNWSEEFDRLLRSVLEEADGELTLRQIIDEIVEREGSFGMDLDLAFPITAHLNELDVSSVEGDDGIVRFRY